MGFCDMLNSAQLKLAKSFCARFVRRMLVRFVFGIWHLVFFMGGDICTLTPLQVYGYLP